MISYTLIRRSTCMTALCLALALAGCGGTSGQTAESAVSPEVPTSSAAKAIAGSETDAVDEAADRTLAVAPETAKATPENETDGTPTEQETTAADEAAATEVPADAAGESGGADTVSDLYEAISQQVTLHSMVSMPDQFITNYYGIDTGTLEEYVFAMSEDATSAETVVIMKAKDESSVDGLTTALQLVIDGKKAEMENYLPEQFRIVDKSEVKVSGPYVYLVISDQADAILRIIGDGIR